MDAKHAGRKLKVGTDRGMVSYGHEVSPLLNFNLAFDFDFGFDQDDELSVLKNKARTEEEINKFATKEDFSPLQKAIHIMRKGYEVQKKSVVSNLE